MGQPKKDRFYRFNLPNVYIKSEHSIQIGQHGSRSLAINFPDEVIIAKAKRVIESLIQRKPEKILDKTRINARINDEDWAQLQKIVNDYLKEYYINERHSIKANRAPQNIHIHGQGEISSHFANILSKIGKNISISFDKYSENAIVDRNPDLILLTDTTCVPAVLSCRLYMYRIPHMQIGYCDNTGIIGPLVIPGLSACLLCLDHYRMGQDATWALLRPQIEKSPQGRINPQLLANITPVALDVLSQIEISLDPLSRPEDISIPLTINQTIEVTTDMRSYCTRTWHKHPQCICHSLQ